MRGYAATSIFPPEAIAMRDRAASMIAALPENGDLRCHELARAVARIFRLTVVDGKYGPVDHSWCRYNRDILDVYCCGRLPMVQLIDIGWQLPSHGPDVYRVGNTRDDIDEELVEWLVTELKR